MKILTVIGTRPEAIKMAPLIRLLNYSDDLEHRLCTTGQHLDMLAHVMDFFDIAPNYNLAVMQPGQDLSDLTCRIMQGMKQVLSSFKPDWVLVHGDTTSALAASLAAFYAGVRVGHVEAGLRTGNLRSPFPEEANRLLVDRLASAHFAPTQRNVSNLLAEGIPAGRIARTGNTVIDALLWSRNRIGGLSEKVPTAVREAFDQNRRVLLVTGHRRENFGEGFEQITQAIRSLALQFPSLVIVYPVHPNPHVQQPVQAELASLPNVFLTAPLDYPDFVYAMDKSWLILTDSGGVQEEAPSLGKPVLVMRDTTERPEAVEAGSVELVGANAPRIVAGVESWWHQPRAVVAANPYGDGHASERILTALRQWNFT